MSVLYLLGSESSLRKVGERLLLAAKDGTHQSIPTQHVEHVVIGPKGHITTQAVYALLAHQVPIVYVNSLGHIQGVLGCQTSTIGQELCQIRLFSDEAMQLLLSRAMITTKLMNQENLLKSHGKNAHHDELYGLAKEITAYVKKLPQAQSLDELRGLEGMASRIYFRGVPYILRRDTWTWNGRNRRPPKDPINAMLSFGYAFLEREVRIAVAGSGMDCRIGFLHANNGRKDSLIFDLMEQFRTTISDRFVFRTANLGVLSPEDFDVTPDGCLLSEAARRTWIQQYEKYMHVPTSFCKGLAPRDWIRTQVKDFADHLFHHIAAEDVV